jgi:hypothetical protein
MRSITKLRLLVLVIVVVALGVGSAWLLLPVPATSASDAFYSPLGTPTTLVDLMLAIGGGVLFLRALRNFKKELKPAWRMVALAQFSLGTLTIVFPIIEYYYLWPNTWWNMSSYLAYLAGSIFMYFGMRKFYKILGLRSRITSVVLMGIIVLSAWILHAFISHPPTFFTERQYDWFEVVPLVPILAYSAAAYMAFRIRSKVGREYKKSFGWLTVGLSLQAVSTIAIGTLELIGYENWYFASRAYEIPTIIGDIGILTAAYYFNAIGLPTNRISLMRRLLGRPGTSIVTSVDIIIYAAGMASDVSKINAYLDGMRLVTARHQTGDSLSEQDQQKLYDVYAHVEKYLTSEERLRTFDVAGLRADIAQHFSLDQNNIGQTFWARLAR